MPTRILAVTVRAVGLGHDKAVRGGVENPPLPHRVTSPSSPAARPCRGRAGRAPAPRRCGEHHALGLPKCILRGARLATITVRRPLSASGVVGGLDAGEHRARARPPTSRVSFSSFSAPSTCCASTMRATRRSSFAKSSMADRLPSACGWLGMLAVARHGDAASGGSGLQAFFVRVDQRVDLFGVDAGQEVLVLGDCVRAQQCRCHPVKRCRQIQEARHPLGRARQDRRQVDGKDAECVEQLAARPGAVRSPRSGCLASSQGLCWSTYWFTRSRAA